jgi:hypothetical protein
VGPWYHRVAPHGRCRPRGHPAVCRRLLVPRLSGCPLAPTFRPASSRSQRLAAVEWGVLRSSFPLVVVALLVSWPFPLGLVLVRAVGVPSFVLSLPSSSLVLAALSLFLVVVVPASPLLFLVVVVPASSLLFHRGPRPCCRCLVLVLVVLSSSSSSVVGRSGWHLKSLLVTKL